MVITNSPDISVLQVCPTWNLSGNSPQIDLINQSQGTNLNNVSYTFIIKSPSQTFIYDGDINNPVITGVWSEWTFYSVTPDPDQSPTPTDYTVAPWPRPFGQIEWSGQAYSIEIIAKDSIGNVYSYTISQFICKPAGVVPTQRTTFGLGMVTINVDCNTAQAFFENITNTSYQGEAGTQESSVLKVLYPDDQTSAAPPPFVITDFSSALVPVTYDSDNYEFVYNGIWNYEFENCSSVLIRYYVRQRFAITCNIDLCPLVCEIEKLIDQAESSNCANRQEINEKLLLINGKLNLAMIAKTQPACGIDLPALIEEIKLIGGFQCDCCSPSGIQPYNGTLLSGYSFQIVPECGDITGSVNVTGNNIQFRLRDKSYVFKICNTAPTTAFTVTPSTQGCTRTYCLNVNMTTLATDILSTIQNNVDLVNMFNSIVSTSGGGSSLLYVDGKCVFKLTATCNYVFGLSSIPTAPATALLVSITSNGSPITLNFSFNQSNLPALNTYLNSLGLGTFTVNNLGSGNIEITSNLNPNSLGAMGYKISGVTNLSTISIDCTGFIPITTNEAIQNIIDYLCGITDNQIYTSQDYEICYIDPTSLQKVVKTVQSGTPENALIAEILDRQCDTVNYITGLGRVDCASIQGVFQPSPALMQLSDNLFGTKAGRCAEINPVELGIRILQLGFYDADFKNTFCAFVTACAQGLFCAPYTEFTIEVVDGSPANTIDIIVTFVHPDAVSNIIRYARVDNTSTPVYTVIPNILPGDSPYTISGLPDGEYVVGITPVYADGRTCSEVIQNTGFPTNGFTAFSAYFDGSDIIVSYAAPVGMPQLRVNVNLPNGGVLTSLHTNTGVDIPITPATGVYGNYSLTLTAVYNQTTGYFGQTTAPIVVNVTQPNNSTFTNSTTNNLAPLSIVSFVSGVYTTLVNVSAVELGGGVVNFFTTANFYKTIVVTYPTGKIGNCYLVTGSGSYVGTIDDVAHTVTFIDVDVSGGIAITALDSSPA